MTSGAKVFITMKTKGNKDGWGYVVKDRPSGDGCYIYAVVDHIIYGDEFWTGSLDDVGAFMGTYGDGLVFCRLRLFTLH